MKKFTSFILILFLISTLGCATVEQNDQPSSAGQSAGIGAVLGAAGGAVAGYLTTGNAKGALTGAAIGAAAGGVSGFIVGKYREKQYKSSNQIYKENPNYTKKNAKLEPPIVTNLRPYILNARGEKVNTIKNGERVELAMTYDLLIPKYSTTKQVEVEECNYLISYDGKEMNKKQLTRNKNRMVSGIDAGIEVDIPKNQPSGKYTHVAIVKIGGQEYKSEQQLQVAYGGNMNKIHAFNTIEVQPTKTN